MVESQRGKGDGEGVLQIGLGQDPGGFIRELVLQERWCWLTEGLRYTGYCLQLMMGTAVAAGLSHTAGNTGWHGLALAGQKFLCAEV